jgi:hypothetical protein
MKAFDIACCGLAISTQKSTNCNFYPPKQFMKHAQKLSTVIDALLTFYEKQDLGKKELLKEHLNREMYILELFAKQPQIMCLLYGPASGPKSFLDEKNKTIPAILLIPENIAAARFLLSTGFTPEGRRVYDTQSFFSESLAAFILGDAFITLTQDNVKKYMLNNGFICPTIERKTSPHNGRKNVWIISAIKALSPEQIIALFMYQYAYGHNKNLRK